VATYRTSFTSPWAAPDVFAYVARFCNAAEWDPGVVEVQGCQAGPPCLGSTYRLVVRFLGRLFALDYEIVEMLTPRRVVLRAENAVVRSTDVIEVEAAPGGGARLTYSATLRLKGPAALMEPLIGVTFHRTGDRAAAGLRAKLAA
jgi:hypothetical protein